MRLLFLIFLILLILLLIIIFIISTSKNNKNDKDYDEETYTNNRIYPNFSNGTEYDIIMSYLYMFPHKTYEKDYLKIDNYFYSNSLQNMVKIDKPLVSFYSDNKELEEEIVSIGGILFDKSFIENRIYYYFPNDSLFITSKRIFCIWFGNSMNENRKKGLDSIENRLLITSDNLDKYILKSNPLHEAFQYLSETHKADYLRTYFMHFYGGGYSDIKTQTKSWDNAFDDIINNKNMYANGYREIGPEGVGHKKYEKHWMHLIGNGAYIFRPNTQFTKKWYNTMINLLDKKLNLLKKHPAKNPRDSIEFYPNTKYPIGWIEMLGKIFHPICYEYRDKLLYTLPAPLFNNYT
jgi:cobalamin biosynthesis Co2+ chelatase CbiK